MLIIIHSTDISLSAKIIRSKLTATQTIISLSPRRDISTQYNDRSREHSPALNTKATRKPRCASIREKNRGGVHFRKAISSRAPSTKDKDTRWRMTIHSVESRACVICVGEKKLDDCNRDNARYRVLANTFSRDLRIDWYARCSRSIAETSLPLHGEDSSILRTGTRG